VREFNKLSRNPATSGRCRRIPGKPCQIPARLAGSAGPKPGSGHLAGILDESDRSGWDTGRIRSERSDPQHLAGSGCSGRKQARTAGFRSIGRDPAGLCRNPAIMAEFRQLLPEFVYAKFKKIFLYYFILIFLFCE
jgi:hypothetical protein